MDSLRGVKGPSAVSTLIEKLPLTAAPVDYMHQVLLGATCALLFLIRDKSTKSDLKNFARKVLLFNWLPISRHRCEFLMNWSFLKQTSWKFGFYMWDQQFSGVSLTKVCTTGFICWTIPPVCFYFFRTLPLGWKSYWTVPPSNCESPLRQSVFCENSFSQSFSMAG